MARSVWTSAPQFPLFLHIFLVFLSLFTCCSGDQSRQSEQSERSEQKEPQVPSIIRSSRLPSSSRLPTLRYVSLRYALRYELRDCVTAIHYTSNTRCVSVGVVLCTRFYVPTKTWYKDANLEYSHILHDIPKPTSAYIFFPHTNDASEG